MKEKLLKGTPHATHGYSVYAFTEGGKYKQAYGQRVLAQAWLPIEEGRDCLDHIDGDRLNNRTNNLRWATRRENQHNRIVHREGKLPNVHQKATRSFFFRFNQNKQDVYGWGYATALAAWEACQAEQRLRGLLV